MESRLIGVLAQGSAMFLYVDGVPAKSALEYSGTGGWIYMAVTYDGTKTSNNVVFYIGSTSVPVHQVGDVLSLNEGSVTTGSTAIGLGNDREISNARPLRGYLDDVRFYGAGSDSTGVLSLGQLELLRRKDISNEADRLEADKVSIGGSILQETSTNGKTVSKPLTIANVINVLGITNAPAAKLLQFYYDSSTQSYVIAPKTDQLIGFGTPIATVFTFGAPGVSWNPTIHSVIGGSEATGLNGGVAGTVEVNGVFPKTVETDRVQFWMYGTVLGLPTIFNGTVSDTKVLSTK